MTLDATRGVDVSSVGQGIFDWNRWFLHIDFAAAKATEGTNFTDPEFPRNWDRMGEMNAERIDGGPMLRRFAYHYFHPSVDPSAQAHFFVSTVMSYGLQEGVDSFMADIEETDGMLPVDVSFSAWVFCHEVTRLAPQNRLIVYTYPAFADQGNCAKLGAFPLWISDFGVPVPEVPPPWAGVVDWTIWQESANGRGNKDVFNGDDAQLQNFCSSTGPWTP